MSHPQPDVLTAVRHHFPDRSWEPVDHGESGASVVRSTDGQAFAKCVPAARSASLAEERDRTEWLHRQGIPAPRVLDWWADSDTACLVLGAVPGVPASGLTASRLSSAWSSITEAVVHLHSVPLGDCPLSRDLASMFAAAHDVVARGAVNPDFLPEEDRATPPGELLARLTPQRGERARQEVAEAVVCHGDLCLPNILVDPETHRVTGFVDLGRLGRADPYADLALLLTNARETWPDERDAQSADRAFARGYGIDLDHERLGFYLALDPLTWG
ncbi:APH(3'') family aminoglycoside O-phosphotransferase [Spiractinospora alimapuensis]|uniref:APH(3'') family aminoglycoside O-phosphotransferase n=1 Tax=Spiractinospora alimapuensis TaxID=2820884 RepID=UPI001EEA8ECE|nr:APH(3'') family aminoglycoside O-phosphotransferase [Spiractinospora alimapuensis]QVQ52864.1 APH(3'') family aminoglycoside O-phosphotransferase [Spiractinospora alimapuensis]